MRTLTEAEVILLEGLTPHARLHALRLAAAHPGLVFTSGRRSVERNRAVGGSPTSWHLRGRAVDVAGPRAVLLRAAATCWAQRVTPKCTGPEEVIVESDHLHVAW